MLAHELYERWRVRFPIHREAFQILERSVEPRAAEKRNGIFGVLVKISVEIPLIHEVGFATDVKENPSQVMQLERCKNRGIFCDRFLNYVTVLAYCLFSARLDLCNDREAIIGRRLRKHRTIATLLEFDVSLFRNRHRRRPRPVALTGGRRLRRTASSQL